MQDTNDLLVAAQWLQSAMLGSVATAIAIIAVAMLGLGLLGGRIEWRRGVGVVLGCFVLFGAPIIAAGLLDLSRTNTGFAALGSPPPVALPTPAPRPTTYDPNAGAALIQHR